MNTLDNIKKFITNYDKPKGGMFLGIVALTAIIGWLIWPRAISEETKAPQATVSMVEVDFGLFRDALSDSCSLSRGGTFKCSENLMARVIRGMDTNAVNMHGNSIELEKNGAYIKIPATLMANLFDLHLIENPATNNQDN